MVQCFLKLFVMSLVATATETMISGDEAYSCGAYEYDETCPTNCSQSAQRYTNDKDYFNCSVGTKKDVSEFRQNNRHLYDDNSLLFDAPKMIGVDFYIKISTKEPSPSLNITFLLPGGIANSWNGHYYLVAVLLTFRSVADRRIQDKFYYECPRERIFQFMNWEPSTPYDSEHPRNISYKCLVGLNRSSSMRVYLINLASIPGHNITYTVTVFPLNHSAEDQTWKPAIATSLDIDRRSIYVVFETAPHLYRWKYYLLYLIDSAGNIVNKTKQHDAVSYTFEKVRHGRYRIMVAVYGSKGFCVNATSTYIDALAIPSEDFPIHYPVEADVWKFIAVGVSCLVVLAILVSVYMFRWRHKHEATPSGLVIHSHHYSPKYRNVVDKFGQYLQHICDVTVHIDIWHDNVSDIQSLQNSKMMHIDHERQQIPSAIRDWVQEKLEAVSFVIVLCAPGQKESNSSIEIKYFNTFLQMASERSKSKNNLWIIPVLFETYASTSDISRLVSGKPVCYLMKDIDKLYCKVHGLNDVPEDKKPYLHTNSYMDKSTEGRELFDALSSAKKENYSAVSKQQLNKKENYSAVSKQQLNNKPLKRKEMPSKSPKTIEMPAEIKNKILQFNYPMMGIKPGPDDCVKTKQMMTGAEERLPLAQVHVSDQHDQHDPHDHRHMEGSRRHRFSAEVHHSADFCRNTAPQHAGFQEDRGYVSLPTESCEANAKHKATFIDHDYMSATGAAQAAGFPGPIDNRIKLEETSNHEYLHNCHCLQCKMSSGNEVVNHHGAHIGHHDYSAQLANTYSNSPPVRKEVGDYMNDNPSYQFPQGNHSSWYHDHQCDGCGNEHTDICNSNKMHSNIKRGFIPSDCYAQIPNHQDGLELQSQEHIGSLNDTYQDHVNHTRQSNYMDPGHEMEELHHNSAMYQDLQDIVSYPMHGHHGDCPHNHYYAQGHGLHCADNCQRNNSIESDYLETNGDRDIYKQKAKQVCAQTKNIMLLPTAFSAVDPPDKVKVNKPDVFDSGIESGETDQLLGDGDNMEKHIPRAESRRHSLYLDPLLDTATEDMFISPLDISDISDDSDTSSIGNKMAFINNKNQY